MMLISGWILAVLLAPIGALQEGQRPDTVMAFVDVTVVPMDREQILEHQTVVVQHGRITAVGTTAAVEVPPQARRIDGRGKFLMPGLADMHAHTLDTSVADLERWLYFYAANGVTTIRTMGFFPVGERILRLRERAAQGELVSPRIWVAAGPVRTAEGIEEAKAAGYDLAKVYGIDGAALDSVTTAAHRLGMPIAGHAPSYSTSPMALARAIGAGYASVEHLTGYDLYLGSQAHTWWWSYWEVDSTLSPEGTRRMLADSAKLRTMAEAMRQAGVWNCPTLAMFDATLVGAGAWPELRYVRPEVLQKLQRRQDSFPELPARATAEAAIEVRRGVVRALHDAGAGLLLGTDTPVPYMVPGFSVHRELEALVRAGLRPYDALLTGTRNVAAYLGSLDSTGTVAVGKRADLILLSGNPLEDIRHTMMPAGVMVGERWLDRETLDRTLSPFEGQMSIFP